MPEPIILKSTEFLDQRGKLEKFFWNDCEWKSLMDPIVEVFMTKSVVGSIRGLHFQIPPQAVNKVIKVINGKIFEIITDLRVGSPNFGLVSTFELTSTKSGSYSGIFIPKGFAHGYQALCDNTEVVYFMDGPFNQKYDTGINTDSFDITWPIAQMVKSSKDKNLIKLSDFKSPFIYEQ